MVFIVAGMGGHGDGGCAGVCRAGSGVGNSYRGADDPALWF
jgi:hypothetical protein